MSRNKQNKPYMKTITLSNINLNVLKTFLQKSIQLANQKDSVIYFKITNDYIESLMTPEQDAIIKHWRLPRTMIDVKTNKVTNIFTSDYVLEEGKEIRVAIRQSSDFMKNVLSWFSNGCSIQLVIDKFVMRNREISDTIFECKKLITISKNSDFHIIKSCANIATDYINYAKEDIDASFDTSHPLAQFNINTNELSDIMQLSKIVTNIDTESDTISIYTKNGGLYVKSASFDKLIHNTDVVIPKPLTIQPTYLMFLCKENYKCYHTQQHFEGTIDVAERIIFKSLDTDTISALCLTTEIKQNQLMDDFDNSELNYDDIV